MMSSEDFESDVALFSDVSLAFEGKNSFLLEFHQLEALSLLIEHPSNKVFKTAEQAVTALAKICPVYQEMTIALTSCEVVGRGGGRRAMETCMEYMRALRAICEFVRAFSQKVEFQLKQLEQSIGGAPRKQKVFKRAEKLLSGWIVLTETAKLSLLTCSRILERKTRAKAVLCRGLIEQWAALPAVSDALVSLLQALHDARAPLMSPWSTLPSRQCFAYEEEWFDCCDDNYLIPGHAVDFMLMRLARHARLVRRGPCCMAVLDTSNLQEYRWVRSGALGTPASCSLVLWDGKHHYPETLTIERWSVDDRDGRVIRQSCRVAAKDVGEFLDICRASPDGSATQRDAAYRCADGLWDKDSFAFEAGKHIAEKKLYPSTFICATETTLASLDGSVMITLYSNVSFAPITRQVHNYSLDMVDASEFMCFPGAFFSIRIRGGDMPPKWLKDVMMWPDLHYCPEGSISTVAVAHVHGDRKNQLWQHSGVALEQRMAEIKKLRKTHKKQQSVQQEQENSGKAQWVNKEFSKDPKSFMTNERTLFAWLGTCTFLALSGISLLSMGSDSGFQAGGLMSLGAAMVLAIYALFRWIWRTLELRRARLRDTKPQLAPFVDHLGPLLAIGLCVVMLIGSVTIQTIFDESKK